MYLDVLLCVPIKYSLGTLNSHKTINSCMVVGGREAKQ